MPSTTALGLPTQLDADPVADLALGIRSLAAALDQTTVRKAADTIKNNTVALANDPHLVKPVANGKAYKFRALLFFIAATSAIDAKTAFTHPGGSILYGATTGMDPAVGAGVIGSGTYGAVSASAGVIAVGVSSALTIVELSGVYACTANGNLQFQFAQNTLTAADLTLKANSFLELQVIP